MPRLADTCKYGLYRHTNLELIQKQWGNFSGEITRNGDKKTAISVIRSDVDLHKCHDCQSYVLFDHWSDKMRILNNDTVKRLGLK